jgi:hypothetical protein
VRRWTALCAALAGAACTVPIAHVDELALAPGPPPRVAAGPAEGRDCRWWVLGVPFGLPRIDAALAAALAETRARVLRDVEVTSEHPTWGLAGRHCYGVRGTAWH